MKILNINVDNVRDYFQTYLEIISPWTPMTNKEARVFATILEIKHKLNSKDLDYTEFISGENLEYLLKVNDIRFGNLNVILSSLRKKGVIHKREIVKSYDIAYEEDGGIIFSLKSRKYDD